MNVNIVDNLNSVKKDVRSPIQQPKNNSVNNQSGVINAWTETGLSDEDNYSVQTEKN